MLFAHRSCGGTLQCAGVRQLHVVNIDYQLILAAEPFIFEVISKLLKSRQMPNQRPAKGAFSAVAFPPSHKAMSEQARQPPQTTLNPAVVLLFDFVMNDF